MLTKSCQRNQEYTTSEHKAKTRLHLMEDKMLKSNLERVHVTCFEAKAIANSSDSQKKKGIKGSDLF